MSHILDKLDHWHRNELVVFVYKAYFRMTTMTKRCPLGNLRSLLSMSHRGVLLFNLLAQFYVAVITKCVIYEIGVVLSVVLCISYSWNVKAGDFKTLTLHWYFLVGILIMSQSWPTLWPPSHLSCILCFTNTAAVHYPARCQLVYWCWPSSESQLRTRPDLSWGPTTYHPDLAFSHLFVGTDI